VQVEVFEVFVDGVLDVVDLHVLLGLPFTLPDDLRLEASVAGVGEFTVEQLVDPVLPADKRSQLPDHPAAPDEERRGCGKGGSDKGERLHHESVTVEPYAT